MTRYYLDTTAHIERWMGDHRTKEFIRTTLDGGRHATSSHALREWKHIVDRSAAEVLNVEREEGGDLSSVFARLSQGYGRRAGQRMRVFSLLTAGTNAVADDLRIRARALVRYQSRCYFHHLIDEVRDGSDCGLAAESVHLDAGRYRLRDTCRKTDMICRQLEFLEAKKPELEDVGRALSAAGFGGLGDLATAAANAPIDGKGKNCYAGLGDVCIALECGGKERLLTTDKAYDVLGDVLGVDVCCFEATRGADHSGEKTA